MSMLSHPADLAEAVEAAEGTGDFAAGVRAALHDFPDGLPGDLHRTFGSANLSELRDQE